MPKIRASVRLLSGLVALSVALPVAFPLPGSGAETTPPPAQNAPTPAWVQRSNEDARVLLAVLARFDPEESAAFGVEGIDERISDLSSGVDEQRIKARTEAAGTLKKRLAAEKDPQVRQDLEISIQAAERQNRGDALEKKYNLPYFKPARLAFFGVRGLLTDQIAPERRPAALVRLRRYAGLEAGYTPITVQAEKRIREKLAVPGLRYPSKAEVERDLATADALVAGIAPLFDQYKITGYQEALARFKTQLAAYQAFIRKEILPKARSDFRLPPELYAFALERVGVDIPPEQLIEQAHTAFAAIQKQMQILAPQVAKQKGYTVTDYRDVIRELKKDQLTDDIILAHYQQRLAQIEAIIRRENLLTLPDRPGIIRLASAAESADAPAPYETGPRLIGNKGERGEFVLPLRAISASGTSQKVDDFSFAAASWTLTAHEARPGHELQFDTMVEKGVSLPRALFAFNSTNVEGWGLYAESIILPFMPPDGQLISLREQLKRAARAFLDPELQLGRITPEQALRVLTDEVAVSPAHARQEVERYTFRSPGQATAYFYGYTQLLALRSDLERTQGVKFSPQRFHDFVLAQGLLPPKLLRQAVYEQLVNTQSIGQLPAR
ncbi:DUF885 domain-containing protein [Gloeobacter kilaueensis]|uniref:DUF885 domain-containing protein n=1 Tax=Gloeobacter kilaueensis (strain ATCC BAA-2537 / CCAP 1431/1 / ULC 316 / JS1) TaxID=1183438 RepID=U5QSN8_GLOK1|nr:DUF885 domain-containing protein [Gloeobacter kilaueensis]AGY60689.1 hypothetical protein GKIL_4443 [Gloeobacter kilaueensis JS1]